jgi:two-component system, OmpR family, phosphate regulon sensor histidine kinase PhoR
MFEGLRFVPVSWPWKRDSDERATDHVTHSQATSGGELVSRIVTALPDPCLVLDGGGVVMSANAQALELFQFNPAGKHFSAAIRSPAIVEAVAQVFRTGEPTRADYEQRVPIPRSFEAFISAIPGEPGQAAVLILLRDLTREQQIERMRADFVANASHELRTPLASLLGFIETLQGAAKNDEVARERFLDLMRTQAERMRRLIGDLLSLSRIEMNAHKRPSDVVDLTQVSRHVVDILSGLAAQSKMEIKVTLNTPLPVLGDWDELVQVVQNLVENAIKYASAGGRVDITGHCDGNHAELSVRDYGPGIQEEHIPRLTERFYRVSVQESRSRGGTGLGLAIVKHILNRHRGRLVVRSELGTGSSFVIRIPLAANGYAT